MTNVPSVAVLVSSVPANSFSLALSRFITATLEPMWNRICYEDKRLNETDIQRLNDCMEVMHESHQWSGQSLRCICSILGKGRPYDDSLSPDLELLRDRVEEYVRAYVVEDNQDTFLNSLRP